MSNEPPASQYYMGFNIKMYAKENVFLHRKVTAAVAAVGDNDNDD